MVDAVETSVLFRFKVTPQITNAPTTIISVSPPGTAFSITFMMIFPLIRFLFSSRASKKDGSPIVNKLINVICDGSKG